MVKENPIGLQVGEQDLTPVRDRIAAAGASLGLKTELRPDSEIIASHRVILAVPLSGLEDLATFKAREELIREVFGLESGYTLNTLRSNLNVKQMKELLDSPQIQNEIESGTILAVLRMDPGADVASGRYQVWGINPSQAA